MSTPCGISDSENRMMSHLETDTNVETCVPANGKSTAHVIRRLSDSNSNLVCLCRDCYIYTHRFDRIR